MIVELEFNNIKRLCKKRSIMLINGDECDVCDDPKWHLCDEFNCPYCNLKDVDDGR